MNDALHEDSHRQLAQFVERYSAGPACLLLGCDDPAGSVRVRAHNRTFTKEHVASLLQLAKLAQLPSKQTFTTSGTEWTFTQLDEGVVVCIGRELSAQSRDISDTAGSHARKTANQTEQSRTEFGDSEAWFKYWSELEVPDISREDLQAHIQTLRNVDFGATALGRIETWGPELLSAFTQCLASPHPVCMAWGEKDKTLLYNQPYSIVIGPHKHPQILGLPYLVAFKEEIDVATAVTDQAFSGRSVVVKNGIAYLERSNYMEETYFSWSMVPIVHAPTKAILGFHVSVFDAKSVITDRRMRFLQKANQAIDLTTTPTSIFQRTCEEASGNIDLPLLLFYECTDSEDAQHSRNLRHGTNIDDEAKSESTAPLSRTPQSLMYARSACNRTGVSQDLFPPHIDISTPCQIHGHSTPSLAKHFQDVQQTHRRVLIQGETLSEYHPYLEKTPLGDDLSCIVLFPIVTGDNLLRAIVVAGLNPRKQYDEDYKLFLQLLQGQITHGVASVRLIQEKLDRGTFAAALTARKNEELRSELEARTNQLQLSEQQFRNVLEKSPAAMSTLNPQGRHTWANPSWWRITGHPTNESPDNWRRHIHEEDLHIPQKLLAQALDITQTIEAVEFRWKRKPGDEFDHWTWADISRNLDENGAIKEIIAVLIDHTDKKILEKILETRADEAIERRRLQEGFIDMTSHEVRNPLAAISLAAEAAVERVERLEAIPSSTSGTLLYTAHEEDINETLANLKIINHCCVHMTRLIDDILTLSKLDNEFLVATPIPCCPVDFITETFSIFKAEMLAKDIKSSLDIRPSVTACRADHVLTDPSRISQLLINLITNAIKFTAPSQIRQIDVTLDGCLTRPALSGAHAGHDSSKVPDQPAAGENIYLLISISDTGCGLSQEEMSGLFQRFKQANPKTHISYGGSGLGLFVCRRIVALLGGEIGVTSQVGKGSTFSFYVPVTRVSPATSAATIPSPTAETSGHSRQLTQPDEGHETDQDGLQRSISVLIVEDNLVNQKLLDKHLQRMGCVTSCANNGQEALDVIMQSKWGAQNGKRLDIVLMDIEMPVMSGLEAIQEIRRLQTAGALSGTIPVLAVTANARPEQIASMLASGFDGTVSKPFKVPLIMDRMRKELQRSAQV